MARAFQCDSCKTLTTGAPAKSYTISEEGRGERLRLDICGLCVDASEALPDGGFCMKLTRADLPPRLTKGPRTATTTLPSTT